MKAVLFTQQTVGLGRRKTGMVFIAETLAAIGWAAKVVTVQMSWLSYLSRNSSIRQFDSADLNVWRSRGPNLDGYLWVPPTHPLTTPAGVPSAINNALCAIYPLFLPPEVIRELREADLVVIESCSAIALFNRCRSVAPRARFVYCASDRLQAVKMNEALPNLLAQTAADYDLIRIPARSMAEDFPADAKVAFIPHGVDKRGMRASSPSPYAPGSRNAVIAGDMRFDERVSKVLVESFPDVQFHGFGRMKSELLRPLTNYVHHGEVALADVNPYLMHGTVGIAPYLPGDASTYLVESSLKLLQYTFARLPTVTPAFAAGGHRHFCGYDPLYPRTAVQAMEAALRFDASSIDASAVLDWREAVELILSETFSTRTTPVAAAGG